MLVYMETFSYLCISNKTRKNMKYRIETTAGKNLYEESLIEDYNEGVNILKSLYEIDKATGMNPQWLSAVTYQTEVKLPNGLVCRTKTYLRRAGQSMRRY